ncbi:MAG: NAD(P)-dependent oxidoreductase, partial [Patescibacteria group bacterium]
MKIFIVSPVAHKLFRGEQLDQLGSVGEVIVSDTVQPLRQVPGLLVGDEERILAIDPDACNWSVENETIKQIPNLKAIILQTTSFSWIDGAFAKSLGIPVMNLPGFSARAVTEWTTMAALALSRKIPLLIKSDWKLHFENHQGYELKGKTAGVIGLGHIGIAVAENLQGLGMSVCYWSKHSRDDRFTFTDLKTV